MKLQDLQPNSVVRCILPDAAVTTTGVQWFGPEAFELTCKDPAGRVGNVLLYRHDESRLALVQEGRLLPVDCEIEKLRYNLEIRDPMTGKLRFLEVKGRVTHAVTITVTETEILHSWNKSGDLILAIVEFLDGDEHRANYIRRPFQRERDYGVTSVNYDLAEHLELTEEPR